jgi:hypothetical protein
MTIMNPIQINLRVTEPLQQTLRQAIADGRKTVADERPANAKRALALRDRLPRDGILIDAAMGEEAA